MAHGLRARLLTMQGDKEAAGLAHRQAVDLLGDIGAKAALGRVAATTNGQFDSRPGWP